MNIDGSNLLSMVTGGETANPLMTGSLPAGGENMGFSAAFMEQLAVLQAGLANASAQQTGLPTLESGKLPTEVSATMQGFAALLGKNLPQAAKASQNIDLDATLQTLADVMQHLQGLDETVPQTASVEIQSEFLQLKPVITAATEEIANIMPPDNVPPAEQVEASPIQPEVVLLEAQPMPSTTFIDQIVDGSVDGTGDRVVKVTDHDDAENRPHMAEQMVEQAATQHAAIVMPHVESVAPALNTDSGAVSLSMLPSRKSSPGTQALLRDNQTSTPATDNHNDDFTIEFERSIASLLGSANTGGEQGGNAGQRGLPHAENPFLSLENAGATVSTAATDKSSIDFTGELGKLSQALPSSTISAKPSVPSAINTPLGNPAWNDDLGQKLIWMHKQAMPSAELRLNPEHLGPVLVKIDVHQDQTSITFTAQHQVVRDAIEAAIPKLREMFNGQQLQLGDVNVSQHQQQSEQRQTRDFFQAASEQGRGRQTNDNDGDASVNETLNIVDEIEAGRALAGNGLLSLFA